MLQLNETPITYYGGKQNLVATIVPLIPKHKLYAEPFFGGGAIYWHKRPSEVEVVNDMNSELVNFYRVLQTQNDQLQELVKVTLHSRADHRDASIIYNAPHLFDPVKRAWALWVLATQSFAGMLDGSWGYDKGKNTTSKKISNKKATLDDRFAARLENTQIENTDALRIIKSRDFEDAFFYCDPPYFNSDCGHYDGYSEKDFEELLETLSAIKGKFLLSSYPSKVLKLFKDRLNWFQIEIEQTVSVANNTDKRKKKIEVLTANYDLSNPKEVLTLFG